MDLSVIIVNYNTAELVVRCLDSIKKQSGVSFEVFVVDNDSKDNSVAIIQSGYPWVTLLVNKNNVGFAKANNQAIKQCLGKFIYFLNPDTEVQHHDVFKKIVFYMETYAHIGLAGTRLVFPDGSPQSSVEFRYPGERYAKSDLTGLGGDVAWLLGASIVARRAVIEETNGFDERFFLYGEDLDLCLAVRKNGWSLGFIEDVVVRHWEGQSEKNSFAADVLKKKLKAELLFFQKHYSPKTLIRIRMATLLQAWWRIISLRFVIVIGYGGKRHFEKLERYRVITRFLGKH